MKHKAAIYVLGVMAVGFGGAIASLVFPDGNHVMSGITQLTLALLTFPLGFLASAAGSVAIFSGQVTPTEAVVFTTPLHALLGYVQWCRLVPYFYRGRA
jgi:hypothetical protein